MEGRALEAEAVLAGAELAEVARGLGHDVVPETEDDAASGLVVDGDVELQGAELSAGESEKLSLRGEGRAKRRGYLRRRWTW